MTDLSDDSSILTTPLTTTQLRGNNRDFGKTNDDSMIGTPSDYVLIAMIIAMMICMTLCCLCLFCRSSNRLTICGLNLEFAERQNSIENIENQSEIHEVVPLTPTTAGEYNNRLPDIESMLRGDAPPPLYNEIVKKAEAVDKEKAEEARDQSGKNMKKKSTSDTGSLKSNGNRSSWRIPGRGILASFRTKRTRASDSTVPQCPTVDEVTVRSNQPLPAMAEETSPGTKDMQQQQVTVETVNEVSKNKDKKYFVYDVKDLPKNETREEDDEVFM